MTNPDSRSSTDGDKRQDPGSSSHGSGHPGSPDLAALARDWITLWQSELAAMAADRETQEAWQTTLALWAGVASATLRAAPRHHEASRPRPHEQRSGESRADDAPRATPAAAAPDPRDAEIKRLAGHVAALEARLAELERGRDTPRPRKRKS